MLLIVFWSGLATRCMWSSLKILARHMIHESNLSYGNRCSLARRWYQPLYTLSRTVYFTQLHAKTTVKTSLFCLLCWLNQKLWFLINFSSSAFLLFIFSVSEAKSASEREGKKFNGLNYERFGWSFNGMIIGWKWLVSELWSIISKNFMMSGNLRSECRLAASGCWKGARFVLPFSWAEKAPLTFGIF